MTEVCEGVAVLLQTMGAEQKCEYEPPDTTWKCNLAGDGGRLAANLPKVGVVKPTVPTKLADVSPRCWPSQAHHLIPWQQLEKHAVTQWLDDAPPKVAGKVLKDNSYDVDHGRNGKFMPYVSDLEDWRKAKTDQTKRQIAERVMAAAGIQLHQGPHSMESYGVGESGYKKRVAEYLDRININSLDHIKFCKECEGKSKGGKVPPRKNVVRFLDTASDRLEVDINLGRIFVSRRAAGFAISGGVMG